MNKNAEHWSGWWWACGNVLYYSLCFYVLFEHSHTTKFFVGFFFFSLFLNHCEYIVPIVNKSFTPTSLELFQWSVPSAGPSTSGSSWPACGWVLLVPSWYRKKVGPKETSHLAKDSRQWRWGKNSHTMEVSATHIVWCLSEYCVREHVCLIVTCSILVHPVFLEKWISQPLSVYPR